MQLNRHIKTLILSFYFHTPLRPLNPSGLYKLWSFVYPHPYDALRWLHLFWPAFFRRCLAKSRLWSEMAVKQRHRGSRRGDKRHKDGLKLSEQLATNEVALASILAKLICWRQNNREQKGDTTVPANSANISNNGNKKVILFSNVFVQSMFSLSSF